MPQTIFLTGYMATGKTTLGRALHEAVGADFVDLDGLVELEAGRTVAEIFATEGEAAFRRRESEALERLCAGSDTAGGDGAVRIVACGGGTPCHGRNMEMMLRSGRVVWLVARPEVVVARLLDAPGQRPLVAGMDAAALRAFHDANLEARRPWYERAHDVFDSSELDTPEQIDRSVERFIKKFINH